MTEVPDDVLDAVSLTHRTDSVAGVQIDDRTMGDAAVLIHAIVPHAQALRDSLAEVGLIPVVRATPAERSALWALRTELDRARADLSTWVDAIDISFRQAAIDMKATEILLADGAKVIADPPRGEWVVNVPMLREEFKELKAHGLISDEDIATVLSTTVIEKADNTKLNVLAKKRGEDVADAIGRARTWKEGNPMSAKLRFGK